jgi:hypothetical protein
MKNLLLKLSLAALLFTGCAGYEAKTQIGKNVVAWWKDPGTQARLESGARYAVQAGTSFAISAGLAALQQYVGGGPIDYGKIAMAGGVGTLYTQASYIRQLQGTHQVIDPIATAKLLEEGGTSQEIAKALAENLIANTKALSERGLSFDQAAEINAAGLDKAAAMLEATK